MRIIIIMCSVMKHRPGMAAGRASPPKPESGMLREICKYVPVVPLAVALLVFLLMPFDESPSRQPEAAGAAGISAPPAR
jgi:hypothetical protein